MSELQLLELIDHPTMPQGAVQPLRGVDSSLRTDPTTAGESSAELQRLRNGGMGHLVTRAAPPQFDLEPVEEGLAGLQRQHLKLRAEVIRQSGSFKRVEDQLERVREATNRNHEAIDRNSQEQLDLLEDLKAFTRKLKAMAMVGISLLVIGLLLEGVMYLHLKNVLPLP
jgi:hypothetical protein